jgi:hypothetical protein
LIGKITTGSSFRGLFDYLLSPSKRARILDGDYVLLEPDASELARQFHWIAATRSTTKKPVKHLSIGFAPEDGEVENQIKTEIAKQIVTKLGYTNNQWVAIAHYRNDSGHDWKHDHDHIHIVVNMVNLDGERIKDSWDQRRLEKILRKLETEYNLAPVAPSNTRQLKAPSLGQMQRYKREVREYRQGLRSQSPEIPLMVKLQAAIAAASKDRPTMTTFIGRLQHLDIDVQPYITDRGKKCISYSLNGLKVRGSKLHQGSFPKLISERGVDFDLTRDRMAMELARQGERVAIERELLIDWAEIDLTYWLPKKLKFEANALKIETGKTTGQSHWLKKLQQLLLQQYGLPLEITQALVEKGLLAADEGGKPIWLKHQLPIDVSQQSEPLFWFATGEAAERAVITDNAVAAVSAYLVETLGFQQHQPTLYLSIDRSQQLANILWQNFEQVITSQNDRALVEAIDSNLVLQDSTIADWQAAWLKLWQLLQHDREKRDWLSEQSKQDSQEIF